MSFINDVINNIMEKIAGISGRERNFLDKVPEGGMFHNISRSNLPAYFQNETPTLKSYIQNALENNSITPEYSSRTGYHADRGEAMDWRNPAYDKYKLNGRTDTLDGDKIKAITSRWTGPANQLDHNTLASQLSFIDGAPSTLSNLSTIALAHGNPVWQYGPAGVIPTKVIQGEQTGKSRFKNIGINHEEVIRSEISPDQKEVKLPVATGIEYYNPKQLAIGPDGAIDPKGIEIARQLKARGAVPMSKKLLKLVQKKIGV